MDDLSIETVFFMIAMLIYERVRYILYMYIHISKLDIHRYIDMPNNSKHIYIYSMSHIHIQYFTSNYNILKVWISNQTSLGFDNGSNLTEPQLG